jgi:Ni,Fe-hydrogenase III small subunit/Pyruvate/2-oxoacid:ferredoxin oxidoreductase delta subunit
MFKAIRERLRQGYRTIPFPRQAPKLCERYRGLPVLDVTLCRSGCDACAAACPTSAIDLKPGSLKIDLGRCLFCTECVEACPAGAINYTQDYRMSVRGREDLWRSGEALKLAQALDRKMLKLFGRSLKLRQVSASGCNACEADINVLTTVVFDLGRFGIQIVASPRHADGLIITGPVSQNMKLALKKTYDALPPPKIVICVGACAISGGPFIDHEQACNGAESIVPVDLYIPGCPPHPLTILDGLLRLMGRLEGPRQAA